MIRTIVDTYRGAFSGLNRTVWLLATTTLVNRAGTMVLPFLMLYLTEKRGFTTYQAGLALALYGLGATGSYFGGWLCDHFKPRRIMFWSLALTGCGFLVLGHLESRPAILATMVWLSVVGEAFRPANAAAVAAASEPGRSAQSFSLMRLAVNIGMTLGPAVGGFLAMRNYDWLFLIDGSTCLIAAVLLWLFFRPGNATTVEREEAPAGRSPWGDPFFLGLIGLLFLLATVIFQMSSTYTLTLHKVYGFSEARIGLILGINTLLIVLFEMAIVHSVRDRDPMRLAGVGSFLFCLGFGLLPFGSTFWYVAFTVAVWSFGEMLSMPIASGVVASRAGEGSRGRYMGLFMLAFAVAFVVAPLIGTWVYQQLGPKTLWVACGAMGIPLWLGFYLLSRAEGRQRAEPVPVEVSGTSPPELI